MRSNKNNKEHAVIQAKDYTDDIIKSTTDALFVVGPDARIKTVNPATLQILGYKEDELIGKPVATIFAEEEEIFKGEALDRLITKGSVRNRDMTFKTKAGETIPVSFTGCVMKDKGGKISGIVGAARDMRERLRLIEDLKNSREELNIRARQLESAYKISKAMSITMNLKLLLNLIMRSACDAIRADSGSIMLFKRGSKDLEIKASIGLTQEIAEFVKQKSGERIAGHVFQKGEPVLLVGGLERYPEFRHVESRPEIESALCVPLKTKDRILGVLNINRTKSSQHFEQSDLELLTILAKDAAVVVENAIMHDEDETKLMSELEKSYDELKQTQAQLIESSKMASVGEFAAGIAHEIRNPLTDVTMDTAFLLDELKDNDAAIKRLKRMEKETDRVSNIVRSLLAFSRPDRDQMIPADINHVIEETLILREYQISLANVQIVRNFDPDLPRVKINTSEMSQVFLNLINNAVDAMPHGGKLFIKTYSGRKEDTSKLADSVFVEFKDQGRGILKDEREKLFTPFHTTKEPGRGIGLGLFMSHGIIEKHRGGIDVRSKIGKGATFTVRLPVEGQDG